MPKQFRVLVITNPDLHYERKVKHERAQAIRHAHPRLKATQLEDKLAEEIAEGRVPVPSVNDMYTVADERCPDGRNNCRRCGDPAHQDACAAAGHCPQCGTLHGIAPDSHLESVGIELQTVEVPDGVAASDFFNGRRWDRAQRAFVSKEKVDRLDDLKTDEDFIAATTGLSAARVKQLDKALARMLGGRRFRIEGEEHSEIQ